MPEKQRRLLAELVPIEDAQARLAWLIERARERPLLPAELRVEAHRVEGCLSKLWFVPEFRDGRCWFRSESDSLFVKAMAGLLCDFYSGHTPEKISATNLGFLKHLGILHQLAENRRRTIARIEEKIRHFAQEHQTKVV